MKELLEPVLKYLPTFVPNFFKLVVAPKTSIVGWVNEDQADLSRPFAFVACTVAIGFLLQLPLLGKDDNFGTLVAAMATVKVIAVVTIGAIIHLLFRMVRGHASFSATLSAYLYLACPLYLMLTIMEIVRHGIVRSHSSALASADRANAGLLRNTPELWRAFQAEAPELANAYETLIFVTFGLVVIWLIATWGAFRRLHERGWFASTTVGVLSLVIGGTAMWGLNMMMTGMFGTSSPVLR